jgi:hypothetical protein
MAFRFIPLLLYVDFAFVEKAEDYAQYWPAR